MSVRGQIFVMSQKLVLTVMDHTGVNLTMIVSQGTRQIQGLVNVLVSHCQSGYKADSRTSKCVGKSLSVS